MSRRVLVTGANGQLGQELRRVAATLSDSYIFATHEQLDITLRDAVFSEVEKEKIDVIINCAAYTNVDRAEQDVEVANKLNNIAVGYLSQAAKQYGATLIHISTDYIFDGDASVPYREECEPNPIGVYGRTKLAGEQSIIASGCRYIILRTSWLYSMWGTNFVKRISELSQQREELSVVADQVGSPTYAADLAEAIGAIIESGQLQKQGVYNYSGDGQCSWFELAQAVVAQRGSCCKVVPISSEEYPSAVQRPHYSVLDKSKFKSTFGLSIPHWSESLNRYFHEV